MEILQNALSIAEVLNAESSKGATNTPVSAHGRDIVFFADAILIIIFISIYRPAPLPPRSHPGRTRYHATIAAECTAYPEPLRKTTPVLSHSIIPHVAVSTRFDRSLIIEGNGERWAEAEPLALAQFTADSRH